MLPTKTTAVSLACLATLLFCLFYGWNMQSPRAEQPFYIGKTAASFANVQSHVKHISQAPHYTGSQQNQVVRDYLFQELQAMGLEVEIQAALATSSNYYVAAQVNNIVAKLPASANHQKPNTMALLSHYDSANYASLGAADAASGVAVIIETVRTLIASQIPRRNDLLIIFSDAEEQGLMGAEAFVAHHRWAKQIDVLLNFEARGSGGPSYTLIETNQGNKKLVEAFATAGVAHPSGNSLMYSIYKMLPNDTDLTVFRQQANIPGFNFAFIDDHFDYHTAQDNPQRLDKSSLLHQMDYATAMTSHFINTELTNLTDPNDLVYVNVFNDWVVSYPFSWVPYLTLLLTVTFIAMLVFIWRQRQLNLPHLALAFAPLSIAILVGLAIGLVGFELLIVVYPESKEIPQGFPYSGHYVIAAAILLSIAATGWIYQCFFKRFSFVSQASWYIPVIVTWLAINTLIANYLPGAGFFIIASFASLIIWVSVLTPACSSSWRLLIITLAALPCFLIITPQIPVFVIGLGLSQLYIASVMSVLTLLILMPAFAYLSAKRAVLISLLTGATASIVAIALTSNYSEHQRKPSSVNYLYDTKSNRAFVFSYNFTLDQFTEQFFDSANRHLRLPSDVYPVTSRRPTHFVKPVAPLSQLQPANIDYQTSRSTDNKTSARLLITLHRPIQQIQIASDVAITLLDVKINNTPFKFKSRTQKAGFILRYIPGDESTIAITFSYDSDTPPRLRLVESAVDLAKHWPNWRSRPAHLMPSPFRPSDLTIISQPLDSPVDLKAQNNRNQPND